MSKILAAIIIVALALAAAGCTGITIKVEPATITNAQADNGELTSAESVPKSEEAALTTPEAAIMQYLEGVAQNDIGKIMAASAVDQMSEGFQLEQHVELIGGNLNWLNTPAPVNYPFYVAANKVQQTARILTQVKFLAYALLSGEDIASERPIFDIDAERTRKFITDVDPARLATIEVKEISFPVPSYEDDSRYVEDSAKRASLYGADEYTERVVIFSFEGRDYYLGFQLLRFGANWKVMEQFSPLGNTSPSGIPVRQ